MLSYLHEFHAGNHADILKHLVLLYTLEYLNKKEKPYTFFDTHSGSGLYNIKSESATKTAEAALGIEKLLTLSKKDKNVPSQLEHYLSFCADFLKKGFYPGSPAFEVSFMNKNSTLFLTELHKVEYEKLIHSVNDLNCSKKLKVFVENKDGFLFLKAKTPPQIKRGVILCDPSYEEKSDYENVAKILSDVHKHWSAATIILWYPLIANKSEQIETMKQAIYANAKKENSNIEILDANLLVDSFDSHLETSLRESIGSKTPRLYGSGVFVVNPCWGLNEFLSSCLAYLSKVLARNEKGTFYVSSLPLSMQ